MARAGQIAKMRSPRNCSPLRSEQTPQHNVSRRWVTDSPGRGTDRDCVSQWGKPSIPETTRGAFAYGLCMRKNRFKPELLQVLVAEGLSRRSFDARCDKKVQLVPYHPDLKRIKLVGWIWGELFFIEPQCFTKLLFSFAELVQTVVIAASSSAFTNCNFYNRNCLWSSNPIATLRFATLTNCQKLCQRHSCLHQMLSDGLHLGLSSSATRNRRSPSVTPMHQLLASKAVTLQPPVRPASKFRAADRPLRSSNAQ